MAGSSTMTGLNVRRCFSVLAAAIVIASCNANMFAESCLRGEDGKHSYRLSNVISSLQAS